MNCAGTVLSGHLNDTVHSIVWLNILRLTSKTNTKREIIIARIMSIRIDSGRWVCVSSTARAAPSPRPPHGMCFVSVSLTFAPFPLMVERARTALHNSFCPRIDVRWRDG